MLVIINLCKSTEFKDGKSTELITMMDKRPTTKKRPTKSKFSKFCGEGWIALVN